MAYNKFYSNVNLSLLEQSNICMDIVIQQLSRKSIYIIPLSSKYFQINTGETLNGYELKYNSKMTEMNSVYFETAERYDTNKPYQESGIYRKDNTIYIILADTEKIIIVSKQQIKNTYGYLTPKENFAKTSNGFVISLDSMREKGLILHEYNIDNDLKETFKKALSTIDINEIEKPEDNLSKIEVRTISKNITN